MIKKIVIFLLLILASTILFGSEKKVMFLDSYREGYPFSDDVEKGIKKAFEGKGLEYKTFRMDSKRNPDEKYIADISLKAKAEIEAYNPDIVILLGFEAAEYVYKEHFSESKIMFVYCGIHSKLGFVNEDGWSNATGIILVDGTPKLNLFLKKYSRNQNSSKVGFLSVENLSSRKVGSNLKQITPNLYTEYVKTFDEWKAKFLEFQESAQILILEDNEGIAGWNDEEAEKFVIENSKIPTGTTNTWMKRFSIVGFMKEGEELGYWAGERAVKILNGLTINDDNRDTTYNKAKLVVNLKISKTAKLDFKIIILKYASELIK